MNNTITTEAGSGRHRRRVYTRVSAAAQKARQKMLVLDRSEWLTLEELCAIYQLSSRNIRRAIKTRALNSANGLGRIGRQYRVHKPTFERRFMGVKLPQERRADRVAFARDGD